MRLNASANDAAVTGAPLWNFAFARWKSQRLASALTVQLVAAAGTGSPAALIAVRGRKICDRTSIAPRPLAFAGSSVERSRTAMWSVPPETGPVAEGLPSFLEGHAVANVSTKAMQAMARTALRRRITSGMRPDPERQPHRRDEP